MKTNSLLLLLLVSLVLAACAKSAQQECMDKGWTFETFASGASRCSPPSTTNTSSSGPNPAPTTVYVPPPPTTAPSARVWFHVVNRHSQKCLSAPPGTNGIDQEACRNVDWQLWYWPTGEDRIDLQSKTGVCVGGLSRQFQQVACNGGRPWVPDNYGTYYLPKRTPMNVTPAHQPVPPVYTGTYYRLIFAGNQCLDNDSWSHDEDKNVIYEDCREEDNDNQLWGFY